MGLFSKKPKEPPPRHRPILTHIIRITKQPNGKYRPEIIEIARDAPNRSGLINVIEMEYESERECRLAIADVKYAFQNGSFRVDVVEVPQESD